MHTATPSAGGPQQLLKCMAKHWFELSTSAPNSLELMLQHRTAPQNKQTHSSFFLIDDSEQIQQLERLWSHTSSWNVEGRRMKSGSGEKPECALNRAMEHRLSSRTACDRSPAQFVKHWLRSFELSGTRATKSFCGRASAIQTQHSKNTINKGALLSAEIHKKCRYRILPSPSKRCRTQTASCAKSSYSRSVFRHHAKPASMVQLWGRWHNDYPMKLRQ